MSPTDERLLTFGVLAVCIAVVLLAMPIIRWWDGRAFDEKVADGEEAARQLGLRLFKAGKELTLSGEREGLGISVDWKLTRRRTAGRQQERPVETTIYTILGIPDALFLKAENLKTRLSKVVSGTDRTVGDPDFDGAVFFEAADEIALAFGDSALRREAAEFVRGGATLNFGKIELTVSGHDTSDVVVDRVERLLSFARRLRDACADISGHLRSVVEHDRDAKALRTLVKDFSGHPDTLAACQRAAAFTDPELRVLAAIGCADDAGLFSLASDESLLASARAEAIEHLLRNADVAREWLGTSEAVLVSGLRDPDLTLRKAAARALGITGGTAAVVPLLELTKGLFADGTLREIADRSVREIQSRSAGAGAGQLSVVDDASAKGALSPATGDGAISIVAKKPQGA